MPSNVLAGIASAVGYFVFPSLGKTTISLVALVCSSLTVGFYLLAELVHTRSASRARVSTTQT